MTEAAPPEVRTATPRLASLRFVAADRIGLRIVVAVVLSLICMVFAADAAKDSAKADKRVAFVVGNGAYKNVAQLPNPPVDAKAMASTLRNVGFDVVEGSNLTRDTMTEKLLEFGKRAQGA